MQVEKNQKYILQGNFKTNVETLFKNNKTPKLVAIYLAVKQLKTTLHKSV